MAPAKSSFSNQCGFSLVEVVVSMAILTTVSLGVAQLFAASTNANRVAHDRTSTTAMAEQKMEQLRSLDWGFDLQGQGLPVTDTTTNLAEYPHRDNGSGLNPSPNDTLLKNTAGFVDYLDANGAWVGTGDEPTAGAAYIRRWAIIPLPTNPNNTLVLQVLVTSVADEARLDLTNLPRRPRQPGDALLISVKTRKAQ
ncbi:MAG TPA: prepilin-type N-terminal cleavage/methylation domain-containing protein [Vicinamibacterales bacterium]|jgi:prepilin-type N-terminal cleavage/methylation domain-containing protein|nr:prepilin-type N-terminal cleavage/methylation domain-containing protein [Vicinamibacterales bacterium]